MEKLKFLVVDDHQLMRQLVSSGLRANGAAEVDMATNGEEALMKVAHRLNLGQCYDIIFLDWNMPVMDGLEVLTKCRSDKRMEACAIVMLTAESEQSQVLRALKAGATSYITKPVSVDEIMKKVGLVEKWLVEKKKNA